MPSKIHFGTNTKRDLDRQSHLNLVQSAIELSAEYPEVQFFVLPPAPLLAELKAKADGSSVRIGSQMVTYTSGFNVTGEISARLLKEVGSELVMVGHAERRAQGEDGPIVDKQLRMLTDYQLPTLLCVGEDEKIDDANTRLKVFKEQLQGLANIPKYPLIVAYEPVWSIGDGGEAAAPEYVVAAIKQIKGQLIGLNRGSTPVLYGGSVSEENAPAYAHICDGLFVGRAAWNEGGFRRVFESGYKKIIKK